jgi:hypothetical protein
MKKHLKVKLLGVAIGTISTALLLMGALNYQSTAEATNQDPIDNSRIHLLNTHIYQDVDSQGSIILDTGFIKSKQFYVRADAVGLQDTVYCHYGTYWSANNTAGSGCLGDRDIDDLNFISVVPYYQNNLITSWAITSGGYTVATIVPDTGHFYLVEANAFAN